MMTVHLYHDGEAVGSWYPEGDQVQVPRKGDTVWIETDKIRFERFRVKEVQWSFRDQQIGISRTRYIAVEVHVVKRSWRPWWQRFVSLFPSAT